MNESVSGELLSKDDLDIELGTNYHRSIVLRPVLSAVHPQAIGILAGRPDRHPLYRGRDTLSFLNKLLSMLLFH